MKMLNYAVARCQENALLLPFSNTSPTLFNEIVLPEYIPVLIAATG